MGDKDDVPVFQDGGRYERRQPDGTIPGRYKFYADQRVEIFHDLGGIKTTHYFRVRFADGKLELIDQNGGFDGKITTLLPLDGQRWTKDSRRATPDFAPHTPGAVWTLDHIRFASGYTYVARKRYTVADADAATMTTTREAFMFGGSIAFHARTGHPVWTHRAAVGQRSAYRTRGEFIEVSHAQEDGQVAWEPVLKAGAGVGDSWTWDGYRDERRVYEIDDFGTHAGQPGVTVRITRTRPSAPGTRLVSFRTYARGVGLVRQNDTYYDAADKFAVVGRVLRVDAAAPGDDGPVKVRAEDFAREFEADQVKANDRYSGRVVEITGVVKGVVNSSAHPQVALVGGKGDSTTPRLSFGSRHKGTLEGIKKGEAITVRGVCTGDAHLHHCSPPGQPDDPPEEYEDTTNRVVNPRKLVLDYLRSKTVASERFAGKEYTLVGYVSRDHTFSRQPHVMLDAGSDLPREVYCRLAVKPAKPFKPGERVFLRGRCVGFDSDLGPGLGRATVLFEGCQSVPEFLLKPSPRLSSPDIPARPVAGTNPVVVVKTSMGDFKIELYEDKAPNIVAHFLSYVRDEWFDGTIFHHAIRDCDIQAGVLGKDMQSKKPPRRLSKVDTNDLKNVPGTVNLANEFGHFYINVGNAADWRKECVMGRVIEGMDVVKKINAVETKVGGNAVMPVKPVTIISIRREPGRR